MSAHHDSPVSEVGRLDMGVRTLMNDLRLRGGVRLDLVGRVLVCRRALHHLRRVDGDDGDLAVVALEFLEPRNRHDCPVLWCAEEARRRGGGRGRRRG